MDRRTISRIGFSTNYKIDCIRDGKIVWSIDDDNLVVNTGLEYAMHRVFGDEEKADWYIGLCTNANSSPGDTAESHEFVEYMGTTNDYRSIAEFVDGGISDNKYTYVATDVQAMITTNETLVGIFMTTGMMKGVDDGTLYGVASFSEPKGVVPGDALLVTVTVSAKG
jgi:hypothetical protein